MDLVMEITFLIKGEEAVVVEVAIEAGAVVFNVAAEVMLGIGEGGTRIAFSHIDLIH